MIARDWRRTFWARLIVRPSVAVLLLGPIAACSFVDDVATRVGAPVKRVFAPPKDEPRPAAPKPTGPPGDEPEAAPEREPERLVSASDKKAIDNAIIRALSRAREGETVAWRNTASGNRGTVAPTTRRYRDGRGRTCRDFQSTVHFRGGPTMTRVGTRCRRAGHWRDPG